ncbi:hypothetical protein ACQY0O_006432 [Thecaphora frezii]
MTKRDIPPISPPQPFTIEFSDAEIHDFQQRLANARLPDAELMPGITENRNLNYRLRPSLAWFKEAVELWKQFDFPKLLAKYNRFDHFTTSIDWCERLHFVHRRSSRADAIPLILIHGWPGSWYEFAHVIDDLAEPADEDAPAFHVVVPSLPGFTFSSPPPTNEPGVGDFVGYTRLLNALMRGLGYDKYASQGGDWGSPHARALGALYAEQDGTGCRAVHLNFCPVSPTGLVKLLRDTLPVSALQKLAALVYDADTAKAIGKTLNLEETLAYYQIQRYRPTQLLYGLTESPIGLLGWLGYVYDVVTANNPTHPTLNTKDLLETATLFHFTKCIGTSFLPYANNPYLPDIHASPEFRLAVPLGFSDFPNEMVNIPLAHVDKTCTSGKARWAVRGKKGGHFAALEEPQDFVSHLRNAFSPNGVWKGHEEDGIRTPTIRGGLWDEVRKAQRNKL